MEGGLDSHRTRAVHVLVSRDELLSRHARATTIQVRVPFHGALIKPGVRSGWPRLAISEREAEGQTSLANRTEFWPTSE